MPWWNHWDENSKKLPSGSPCECHQLPAVNVPWHEYMQFLRETREKVFRLWMEYEEAQEKDFADRREEILEEEDQEEVAQAAREHLEGSVEMMMALGAMEDEEATRIWIDVHDELIQSELQLYERMDDRDLRSYEVDQEEAALKKEKEQKVQCAQCKVDNFPWEQPWAQRFRQQLP